MQYYRQRKRLTITNEQVGRFNEQMKYETSEENFLLSRLQRNFISRLSRMALNKKGD
jgi:hypothetical protein